MKTFGILIYFSIFFLGCTKESEIDCVNEKIKSFKEQAVCDMSVVKQYTFQGNTVYVFDNTACCCDHTAEVIDSQCKVLGTLGGFAGFNIINGLDFYKHATQEKILWKK